MTATYIAELPEELRKSGRWQIKPYGNIVSSGAALPHSTGMTPEERDRDAAELLEIAYENAKRSR